MSNVAYATKLKWFFYSHFLFFLFLTEFWKKIFLSCLCRTNKVKCKSVNFPRIQLTNFSRNIYKVLIALYCDFLMTACNIGNDKEFNGVV